MENATPNPRLYDTMDNRPLWYKILEYIETHDGQYGDGTEKMIADLGTTERTFYRYMRAMERQGVIEVRRIGRAWGTGRLPNVYCLLITADEWRSVIATSKMDKIRAKKRAHRAMMEKRRQRDKAQLTGEELIEAEMQLDATIHDLLRKEIADKGEHELEINAWLV